MNTMICNGFSQEEDTTVILMYLRKLVSYYISKGFVILEHKSDALENVPLKPKQNIQEIIGIKMIPK